MKGKYANLEMALSISSIKLIAAEGLSVLIYSSISVKSFSAIGRYSIRNQLSIYLCPQFIDKVFVCNARKLCGTLSLCFS